jgi:hypothetical protein
MIKGSCLCEAVALEIEGSIHNARYCHCANCRKFSGTAYAAWGLVRSDALTTIPVEPSVTGYDSGGGLRVFCTTCGSPLWYEPAGLAGYRGIPLGVIHEGAVPTPAMHVWTKSKAPWVSITDGLPQHETHPQPST